MNDICFHEMYFFTHESVIYYTNKQTTNFEEVVEMMNMRCDIGGMVFDYCNENEVMYEEVYEATMMYESYMAEKMYELSKRDFIVISGNNMYKEEPSVESHTERMMSKYYNDIMTSGVSARGLVLLGETDMYGRCYLGVSIETAMCGGIYLNDTELYSLLNKSVFVLDNLHFNKLCDKYELSNGYACYKFKVADEIYSGYVTVYTNMYGFVNIEFDFNVDVQDGQDKDELFLDCLWDSANRICNALLNKVVDSNVTSWMSKLGLACI